MDAEVLRQRKAEVFFDGYNGSRRGDPDARVKMAGISRRNDYSEQLGRVLVDQLLDLVVEDYQFNKRGSSYDTEHRIEKHLRPTFGQKRAEDVTTPMIKKYTADRARDAAPATVNKELAFLRRAFRLGVQHDPPLVERVPHIRMLPVDNTRDGIIEHETIAPFAMPCPHTHGSLW